MTFTQGVRNRRERQLTRFALPYDYTCFADGTPFYIELFGFFSRALQEKYVLAKLVKENWANTYFSCGALLKNQTARYKMEYRLQSMYNHVVGRTVLVISPFYSLLPAGMPDSQRYSLSDQASGIASLKRVKF